MDTLELVPAYGADYTSAKSVREAWAANKDFKIASYGPEMGRYINKRDAQDSERYMIRYAKLQKVIVI